MTLPGRMWHHGPICTPEPTVDSLSTQYGLTCTRSPSVQSVMTAPCSMTQPAPILTRAAQLDAGAERAVAADLDAGLDVEPLGIAHGHARAHERLGQAHARITRSALGDVDAVVAAHDLVGGRRDGHDRELARGRSMTSVR